MSGAINDKGFEGYLKTLEILYVEDEEAVRDLIEKRLAKHFGKIHSAPNGEVGLYKYDSYRPKIVVTDIRMPIMNGIEMLQNIKEKNPEVKAIVTTAYSDSEYMLQSIDLGVDKYIIKPVNVDSLLKAVKKLATNLYYEEMIKENQRAKLQNEIVDSTKNVFEQISGFLPSPIAICSRGKVAFMNSKFTELFGADKILEFSEGRAVLDDVFGGRESIKEGVGFKKEMRLPSGRKKIFEVTKVRFTIDGNDDFALYYLKDLTRLEYKNIKLQSYADILCDILKIKAASSKNTALQLAASSRAQPIEVESIKLGDILNAEELEALRRNHIFRTSAKEYTADLSQELLEELDELKELEVEIDDLMDGVDGGDFKRIFQEVGKKFIAYSRSIGKLVEFEDLALSVRNFGAYLTGVEEGAGLNWSRLLSFTENIRLDLVSWRNTIFTDKSAIDIHYLDSSLLSSCIQAQLGDSKTVSLEDENDLELF